MTTPQQLVVDVFQDRAQAEQAVNELLQSGFDNSQIRLLEQGGPTGGMLEKFKGLFTGQDVSTDDVYNDLVNMGTPSEDAHYYQSEFAAGRTLVVAQGTGGMQEVINVLARNGGHGANQRFAQSANYAQDAAVQGAGVQEPTSENVNTEYNRQRLQQQEARAMQENQQTASSNTYYDLVSILYHALQMEHSSATYVQDAQHSGNQDLAQFFDQVHQNASLQADRARQLLGRISSSSGSFGNDQPEQNRAPARVGDFSDQPEQNRASARAGDFNDQPEQNRTSARAGDFSDQPEQNRPPVHVGSLHPDQGYHSQESHYPSS
jgi:hypothetical protein